MNPIDTAIREEITKSGHTLYSIAMGSGIPWQTLHNFMQERTGLSLSTLNKLVVFLKLKVVSNNLNDLQPA